MAGEEEHDAILAIEQENLANCLSGTIRLSGRQIEVLVENGFDTARTFVHWKYKAVSKFCSERASAHLNRGGVTYGARKVRCLQGFAWWCTDRRLRGKDLNLNLFDENTLEESLEESELHFEESEKKDEAEKPVKFTHDKWIQWEESIITYFSAIKNSRGIPLSYVIRKENEDISEVTADIRDQEMINNASLAGPMFIRDSKRILTILKELTIGTDAETWMKGKKCGRLAMEALQNHYDGPSEGERRKQIARSDLEKLFYRNETTFSFEKYVTIMKMNFEVLRKYEVPVHEEDKTRMLLNNINCPNAELKTEINICRSQHADTFENASTYIATQISRIFPEYQPSSGRYAKGGRGYRGYSGGRNISAFGRGRGRFQGRGGRGNRGGRGARGYGRGGRGGRGGRPTIENGIDISDPTRWYDESEFSALSHETRKRILENPTRAEAIEARRKRRKTSSSTTSQGSTQIAAIITGVMNAQRNNQENTAPMPQIRTLTSGNNRAISSVPRSSQNTIPIPPGDSSTIVTYDHLGNVIG